MLMMIMMMIKMVCRRIVQTICYQ